MDVGSGKRNETHRSVTIYVQRGDTERHPVGRTEDSIRQQRSMPIVAPHQCSNRSVTRPAPPKAACPGSDDQFGLSIFIEINEEGRPKRAAVKTQ